jgi:GMP synthase-like glutamine amidotransferase
MAPVVGVLHNLTIAYAGHAGAVLRDHGIELDERELLGGDVLPALDEVDGLLVLGGDQSVLDVDRDPLMAAEAALIREAVDAGVPVFGVCLGAQLLAYATGGTVARLPRRMVEWAPLIALDGAAGDPVAGALPAGAMALHWNEDGFEPPPGAVELLGRVSAGGEAFRVGESAWGIQFHPEVDAAGLEDWYAEGGRELAQAGVTEAAARLADAEHLPGQGPLSAALFGGFARVVAARTVTA